MHSFKGFINEDSFFADKHKQKKKERALGQDRQSAEANEKKSQHKGVWDRFRASHGLPSGQQKAASNSRKGIGKRKGTGDYKTWDRVDFSDAESMLRDVTSPGKKKGR